MHDVSTLVNYADSGLNTKWLTARPSVRNRRFNTQPGWLAEGKVEGLGDGCDVEAVLQTIPIAWNRDMRDEASMGRKSRGV